LKVSLNWLKDYVDLSNISAHEIIEKLTMCGLEVEDYVDQNELYKNFVVGLVKDKKKHPNADKLSLCVVNDGKEDLQIICGAPNVESGQKIVLAEVGSVIPNGTFELKKAKIRGIESNGMICSEAELNISDNHDGIMILDNGLKPGTLFSEALGMNDVIMEVAITPNRSDALSHIGIARDLAAIFNRKLKIPKIKLKETAEKINNAASIIIDDDINCPRYSAKTVKNIEVKESPTWLKKRLTSIGLRPINNIVDITNFVMYECGQPLHAFDLDLLSGHQIIVKSTKEGSTFTTLDSKERKLPENVLMICDSEKPVAIAGIMGGENSEINSMTKNVLIESAHFNRLIIRKSSKALGLSSEASYRFERFVDPGNTVYAAERTAQLISELSGGDICKGTIDVYPKKIKSNKVKLRFSRVKKLLGYEISKKTFLKICKKLQLEVISESEKGVWFLIPSFRPDLEREADLIEEVARIYGYDNIPTVSKINIGLGEKFDDSKYVDDIKIVASGLGFYEMINNPMQPEKLALMTGNPVKVLNPQSADMSHLRTSLIPGALSAVSRNINVNEKDLMLFEIGNVFNLKESKKVIESFDDYTEGQNLLFLITGRKNKKQWNLNEDFFDFYYLKGIIKSFLIKFSLDSILKDSYYNATEGIYEFVNRKIYQNNLIGKGGRISSKILRIFDIDQDVFCYEFDFSKIKEIKITNKLFKEPLKFPKVEKDFAFIFDKSVSYEEVKDYINSSSSGLLKSVELFDIFESDSLGENKKSMAFTLEFFFEERTLVDAEVDKEFKLLIDKVTKKFNAKLRG
jgi:phenylalanyl-tRNA synthetase beta chain